MGMAKIIDADLLLQWVEKAEAYNMGRISCGKKPKGLTPEGVRHMIDTMPNVDVVPVVRCKDCIYNKTGSCAYSENVSTYYDPNWFCADGERKDNERQN